MSNNIIYSYDPNYDYKVHTTDFTKWYINKYGENGTAPFVSQLIPPTITVDLGNESGVHEWDLKPLKFNVLNRQIENQMYDSYMAGCRCITGQASWDLIKKALRGERLSDTEFEYAKALANNIETFEGETEKHSSHIYEHK